MAVIQREFRSGEFHVANDGPFQDDNISWEAKGVLGYLFSKPDDWTPRIYDIVQAGACEKYKIKRIFKELEEYGYLEREKIRDDEGQFDWKVTVWDHPRQRPGWTAPAPDSAQHGQNGGANNTDSQSDGQTVNTESEARAREECEAVEMYHDIFPRRATSFQQELIERDVDDLEAWKGVLTYWRGNGYRGKSVKKMLSKYKEDLGETEDKMDESWTGLPNS